MDFLKSAVASAISKGPPFPYTFGDQVDIDPSIWKLYNGTKKDDGANCSIFTFDVVANKSRLVLARNAVKKLRTLRHPGVVKFLEVVETDTYIYVATERLVPLRWHIRRKSMSLETLKWGLYCVAKTVKFINDEAKSVHGNLRVASLYTSESGEWRVGGFEILSSMNDDEAIIYTFGTLIPDGGRYMAPEVAKTGWDAIKRNPLPSVDAYNFGALIYEAFNGDFVGPEQAGQTKSIPPKMHSSYRRLVNANPKARLSTGHFLEQGRQHGSFFDTPLIKLAEGVDNLGMKTEEEREEFLSDLDQLSEDFPEDYFKIKILPELLKSVEFGGGGPKVFAVVMKIGTKLTDEDFEARMTPVVIRLFASQDRAIRVCLLDNLPSMIERLSQKIVNERIFPNMITGFTDVAPIVREQTVKAVLTIIGKLSERTINGDLLKYLAKTANDEQPGIRTNTVICLGKISKNLGAHTRSKVLIAAFTRALRDPFVHARNAALMALAVTSDCFSEDDCATKILPALCSCLLDKEKVIRDQANKSLDAYLSRVRKHALTMPDTVLPPPSNDATNIAAPSVNTTSAAGTAATWTGWAISSFTNKLSSAAGDMQSANGSVEGPSHDAHQISSRPTSAPTAGMSHQKPLGTSGPTSTLHRPALTATSTARTISSDAATGAANDDDGLEAWGDMEEDNFFDAPDNDEASQEATLGTEASSNVSSTPFDDDGEPDFAGWLAAQAQKRPGSKPLPKGLTKAQSAIASRPGPGSRTATTGSVGSGTGARNAATTKILAKPTTAKKIDTAPKDTAEDDGWGDGW